ncbi:MAG TPA: histidinol-phosphate transaminase [Candidatus Paceibacterota bacterium]|nr:histidinol-phosphate transaminase [Verrucomicrobiota bacterium]HRY47825.1 histidinol-phosphate transaminase [Candidatus Paceibacterota bacterium]HSA00416.1 histidinol-phosphate transaminase [Candidatus Paceibacterota bacterium]
MNYLRSIVRQLQPYTPGEQPRIKGLIKLNTNENPYPPSPKVLSAVKAAVDDRLRRYPNPSCQPLREALAKYHQCDPEQIFVGNGADEVLAVASRAFVEPAPDSPGILTAPARDSRMSRCTIQYFDPSYSLYPVLAAIHGAYARPVELPDDFCLPSVAHLKKKRLWDFKAALSYITTPNAPSGVASPVSSLREICLAQKGIVLLDEAYVDFSGDNAMSLAFQLPNVLVARTFSKAYSLCFQRIGYAVGHHTLIQGLQKIRDSYNVNGLGQVAALATLGDLSYYQKTIRRVIASREKLSQKLTELDFEVARSQTNFIFAKPPLFPAEQWLTKLRDSKILVRWFNYPRTRDFLRISIGSEQEIDHLLKVVRTLVGK